MRNFNKLREGAAKTKERCRKRTKKDDDCFGMNISLLFCFWIGQLSQVYVKVKMSILSFPCSLRNRVFLGANRHNILSFCEFLLLLGLSVNFLFLKKVFRGLWFKFLYSTLRSRVFLSPKRPF